MSVFACHIKEMLQLRPEQVWTVVLPGSLIDGGGDSTFLQNIDTCFPRMLTIVKHH